MIDLNRTRAELLSDIEASEPIGPVHEIPDARVVRGGDCHVRMRGRTRDDLFPWLRVALTERFAAVPRPVLVRDLLMPLKHALGNAERHGNGDDPDRAITVELVLTGRGAFIAVADEGAGFDVSLTIQRWREQQTYFVHAGKGFHGLHRARAAVSWENGGRTLLLCFRPELTECDATPTEVRLQRAGAAPRESFSDAALRPLLDPAWIETCLAPELSDRANGLVQLESGHAYLNRGPAGDDCGIRYVLRVASEETATPEARILTARVHENEETAAAEFAAATRLNDAQRWKGLRPAPVVLWPSVERRLVFYDFDPWMNLWQYLAYRGNLKGLRHAAMRAGEALALLHRSQVVLRRGEPDSVVARFDELVADGQRALDRLPRGADLGERFRAAMQRIHDRASAPRERVSAPIHGALGWDCIHFGVDSCFYFYRFDACRQSDPGLDVGGYAADLLRFTLATNDGEAYRICRDDLLTSYNAEAAHPLHQGDLPPYIALAIGERVRDGRVTSAADAHQLLAALEAAG